MKQTFNQTVKHRQALGRTLLKVLSKGKHLTLRDARAAIDTQKALHLIAQGADLTLKDDTGATALLYACLYGHEVVALALIRAKADVNAQDPSLSTPLIRACFFGTEKMIHALLDAGADVTLKDNGGHDASYYARDRHSDELLEKMKRAARRQKRAADKKRAQERQAEIENRIARLRQRPAPKAIKKKPSPRNP